MPNFIVYYMYSQAFLIFLTESDHDDENDSVTDGPPVPKRPHISEISPKKLEQNQDVCCMLILAYT